MDEVAALTGADGREPWSARRVRDHLLKINEELHGTLLENAGGEGRGARWTITWNNLRKAMPDWFDGKKTDSELLEEVQQELKAMGSQILSMARRIGHQEKELQRVTSVNRKPPLPRVG